LAPWGFFRSRADFLWRLRISSADRGNLVPVRIFAVEVRLLAAVGISQARAERRRFSAFLKLCVLSSMYYISPRVARRIIYIAHL
jgi:hypothetical protein